MTSWSLTCKRNSRSVNVTKQSFKYWSPILFSQLVLHIIHYWKHSLYSSPCLSPRNVGYAREYPGTTVGPPMVGHRVQAPSPEGGRRPELGHSSAACGSAIQGQPRRAGFLFPLGRAQPEAPESVFQPGSFLYEGCNSNSWFMSFSFPAWLVNTWCSFSACSVTWTNLYGGYFCWKNMYCMTFLCGKVLRLSVHASTYTIC